MELVILYCVLNFACLCFQGVNSQLMRKAAKIDEPYAMTFSKKLTFFSFFLSSLAFFPQLLDAAEYMQNAVEYIQNTEEVIDRIHGEISGHVTNSAEWIDKFFDDENYLKEENTTRLRISVSSYTQKGEDTDFKAKVNFRLRLPGFSKRLRLFLNTESDELDNTSSVSEDIANRIDRNDDQSTDIGLSYYFKDSENYNIKLTGGARASFNSPALYLKPRFRYFKNLDTWDMRAIEEFVWYTDGRLKSRTELQLERPIPEEQFFRTTGRIDWYTDKDGVYPKLQFELWKILSKKRVVSLGQYNFFKTDDNLKTRFDSAVISINYRQRLWRKWLWFEVTPEVSFPRDRDYDATPGIELKLEANFNKEAVNGS